MQANTADFGEREKRPLKVLQKSILATLVHIEVSQIATGTSRTTTEARDHRSILARIGCGREAQGRFGRR
jgi:hypothetical protein